VTWDQMGRANRQLFLSQLSGNYVIITCGT